LTDLKPYINQIDILKETAEQVIKDFSISGMEIKFTGDPKNAYADLYTHVLPNIERLQKENFQNFYNLMYRIDLSEAQIKKAVKEATNKTFAEIVTDMILKRELLKVVMRKKYASGEKF